MAGFPTLDAMDRPWQEPELYRGESSTVPVLAYDGGQVGSLTVRAGCVGAEKRRPWHNGNDSFSVGTDRNGSLCLLAVADGVGDHDGAGRAARAATTVASHAFRQRLAEPGQPLESLLRDIFGDVDRTLYDRQREAPGYRTTLVVAVLPTAIPPGGEVVAAVGRVGDSTAWRIRGGRFESVFPLDEPSTGIPAATHALPGHIHRLDLRTGTVRDGEVLALTTDGLARGERDERATGFLGRLWTAPPTPLAFLAALGVRRNDRDDDRAAAVAWLGHYEQRTRSPSG